MYDTDAKKIAFLVEKIDRDLPEEKRAVEWGARMSIFRDLVPFSLNERAVPARVVAARMMERAGMERNSDTLKALAGRISKFGRDSLNKDFITPGKEIKYYNFSKKHPVTTRERLWRLPEGYDVEPYAGDVAGPETLAEAKRQERIARRSESMKERKARYAAALDKVVTEGQASKVALATDDKPMYSYEPVDGYVKVLCPFCRCGETWKRKD